MSYNKLCINGITFDKTDLNKGIKPYFTCPLCNRRYDSKYSWDENISIGTHISNRLDFNRLVSIRIPQHEDTELKEICKASDRFIELYVAVYKDKESIQIAFSVEPINGDWWKKYELPF